ncbi:unnamed protein product [Meganyctiphanes norvegica]|uniref:Uncharacterized protein n=1 Tax=Meganyctiphanes norvegica TaxID=48144 RepID=A0AAV2RBG3_MEGNR
MYENIVTNVDNFFRPTLFVKFTNFDNIGDSNGYLMHLKLILFTHLQHFITIEPIMSVLLYFHSNRLIKKHVLKEIYHTNNLDMLFFFNLSILMKTTVFKVKVSILAKDLKESLRKKNVRDDRYKKMNKNHRNHKVTNIFLALFKAAECHHFLKI